MEINSGFKGLMEEGTISFAYVCVLRCCKSGKLYPGAAAGCNQNNHNRLRWVYFMIATSYFLFFIFSLFVEFPSKNACAWYSDPNQSQRLCRPIMRSGDMIQWFFFVCFISTRILMFRIRKYSSFREINKYINK